MVLVIDLPSECCRHKELARLAHLNLNNIYIDAEDETSHLH